MRDTLINDELLEDIRISRDMSKWNDSNYQRIVEFGYTHEYLLAYRKVDDIILEFYLKSIKDMFTSNEWKELKKLEKEDANHIISNCSYLIEGALHNKSNLYIKIGTLLELKDQHNLHNKYEYLSDLKSYFSNYARDFESGYNQFLNVIVKPFLLLENDREHASQIIFRFLTNNQSNDPVTSLAMGFKMRFEKESYELEYELSDGLNEGYLYKAWSIVFSQNDLFLPLFKKYLNPQIINDPNKTELKKEEVLKMQNNLIPRLSLEYVYDFFSILIEPNKRGTFYLDHQKLLIFIESTFVHRKPIQQSFNVSLSKDKKDIRSVFKKFLDNCSELESHEKNLKRKYFKILDESFTEFNDKYSFDKWAETNNVIPTIPKPKGNYLVGRGNF